MSWCFLAALVSRRQAAAARADCAAARCWRRQHARVPAHLQLAWSWQQRRSPLRSPGPERCGRRAAWEKMVVETVFAGPRVSAWWTLQFAQVTAVRVRAGVPCVGSLSCGEKASLSCTGSIISATARWLAPVGGKARVRLQAPQLEGGSIRVAAQAGLQDATRARMPATCQNVPKLDGRGPGSARGLTIHGGPRVPPTERTASTTGWTATTRPSCPRARTPAACWSGCADRTASPRTAALSVLPSPSPLSRPWAVCV
jgi:hypothetical protein